jgi:hypothetical protein
MPMLSPLVAMVASLVGMALIIGLNYAVWTEGGMVLPRRKTDAELLDNYPRPSGRQEVAQLMTGDQEEQYGDEYDDSQENTHGLATSPFLGLSPRPAISLQDIVQRGPTHTPVVVQRILDGTGAFGFNAATDVYEDLEKAGVIDPTKVSRTALQNAASVAGLLLTTEAMVAEKPKRKAAGAGGGGGMGGGMEDMDY